MFFSCSILCINNLVVSFTSFLSSIAENFLNILSNTVFIGSFLQPNLLVVAIIFSFHLCCLHIGLPANMASCRQNHPFNVSQTSEILFNLLFVAFKTLINFNGAKYKRDVMLFPATFKTRRLSCKLVL